MPRDCDSRRSGVLVAAAEVCVSRQSLVMMCALIEIDSTRRKIGFGVPRINDFVQETRYLGYGEVALSR